MSLMTFQLMIVALVLIAICIALLFLTLAVIRVAKATERVGRILDRSRKARAELQDELDQIAQAAASGAATVEDMKRADVIRGPAVEEGRRGMWLPCLPRLSRVDPRSREYSVRRQGGREPLGTRRVWPTERVAACGGDKSCEVPDTVKGKPGARRNADRGEFRVSTWIRCHGDSQHALRKSSEGPLSSPTNGARGRWSTMTTRCGSDRDGLGGRDSVRGTANGFEALRWPKSSRGTVILAGGCPRSTGRRSTARCCPWPARPRTFVCLRRGEMPHTTTVNFVGRSARVLATI